MRIPLVSLAKVGKKWTQADHDQLVREYNELHESQMAFPSRIAECDYVILLYALVLVEPGIKIDRRLADAMGIAISGNDTSIFGTKPPLLDCLKTAPDETCLKVKFWQSIDFLRRHGLVKGQDDLWPVSGIEVPNFMGISPDWLSAAQRLLVIVNKVEEVRKRVQSKGGLQ